MSAANNQPDWDAIAEKFDLWLPHIAPVGDALIEALDTQPGDRVIDLGSGTGEPALTLSVRMKGSAEITGIDSAAGMVRVANSKVETAGLQGIRFVTMAAESLDFANATFDRALCRFGVMLFEDPVQGLSEMHRVLKAGGRFALAVWSTPETMPTMHWSYKVFSTRLPDEDWPPLTKVTSMGGPGVLEDALYRAGFSDYTIETRKFDYEFDSFDAFWDTVEASDILKQQYDALPDDERGAIRDEVGHFARDFVRDGRLLIPHEYLLATGVKTTQV